MKKFFNSQMETSCPLHKAKNRNLILLNENRRLHTLFDTRRKKIIIQKYKKMPEGSEATGLTENGEHIVFKGRHKLGIYDFVTRRDIIDEKLTRESEMPDFGPESEIEEQFKAAVVNNQSIVDQLRKERVQGLRGSEFTSMVGNQKNCVNERDCDKLSAKSMPYGGARTKPSSGFVLESNGSDNS
jgi:hypothetical protein